MSKHDLSKLFEQGDGDSLPEIQEDASGAAALNDEDLTKSAAAPSAGTNPFTVQISIDGLCLALFFVSLATRVVNLDKPRNVV